LWRKRAFAEGAISSSEKKSHPAVFITRTFSLQNPSNIRIFLGAFVRADEISLAIPARVFLGRGTAAAFGVVRFRGFSAARRASAR
jgi:hypothetical protein